MRSNTFHELYYQTTGTASNFFGEPENFSSIVKS